MALQHIVAAVDGSIASHFAVETAGRLADRAGAELRLVRVVPALSTVPDLTDDRLGSIPGESAHGIATAVGLPSIEITRFAEAAHADLLVLGRPFRSETNRRLVGDTGDAVARRSTSPVLFVRPIEEQPRRMLVALDGTDRGLMVLRSAEKVARAANLELHAVTVEPESRRIAASLAELPSATGDRLARELDRLGFDPQKRPRLTTRYGEPVAEILAQVADQKIDVLAVGFHRGGPAGMVEGASVGRRLLHAVGCAVLTVPL